MNRLRWRLEAALARAAGALVRRLSVRALRRLGGCLGEAWYWLDLPHRRIALANLARAFPEASPSRRRGIARASFRHFAAVALDLLRFPAYGRQDAERLAEVKGWEHLEAALAAGRGALVFSGHFGHWELVALLQGFRGRPMDMVTRPLDNPHLEERLARCRAASGNRVIHKRSAVRGILRALREGRSVALVIDQNFREANRVFVDFLGRAAATTPILGLTAVRSGAPAVPVFSWPLADGRTHIEYLPALHPDPSVPPAEAALALTRECTRRIEDQVRRRPEWWLWMHRRWRTRPDAVGQGSPVSAGADLPQGIGG